MIVAVAALTLLSACASDATVAQPEDEFLDKVEAPCRTAKKDADKLDLSAAGSRDVDKFVDVIKTLHDAIKNLDPPASLKKDFENLVGDLNDQVSQGRKVVTAIDSGDTTAVSDAVSALVDLTAGTNSAAQSLGALRCKYIADVSVIGLGLTDDSIPDQTIPVDTTPDTVPIETVPIETVPIETVDTSTIDTVDPAIYPNDLNLTATAPPGFTWSNDLNQNDAARLFAKPDLGPVITDYSVGQLFNDAEGYSAGVYVMTISGASGDLSTPVLLDQYLTWEVLADGTQSTTPAGYPIYVKIGAFDDTDCIGYVTGLRGVSVCTATGIDGAPILDAYIAANPA
ncbi:MAG: hypothetical protein ABIR32_04810 [Ilumatobacteraceae bacterium]